MQIEVANEKLSAQEIAPRYCHEVRLVGGKRAHEFELVLFRRRWYLTVALAA